MPALVAVAVLTLLEHTVAKEVEYRVVPPLRNCSRIPAEPACLGDPGCQWSSARCTSKVRCFTLKARDHCVVRENCQWHAEENVCSECSLQNSEPSCNASAGCKWDGRQLSCNLAEMPFFPQIHGPDYCLNGGTLRDSDGLARCHCADRWFGDQCESCPSQFADDCLACLSPNPSCSPCSIDVNCHSRASSVAHATAGDPTCHCACLPGWGGAACEHCVSSRRGDNCDVCAEGHAGLPDCVPCDPAVHCNGAAVHIRASDCVCTCEPTVTGERCDRCAPGHVGSPSLGCEQCTTQRHCKGRAASVSAVDNVCVCSECKRGWAGSRCHTCMDGWFDRGDGVCAKCTPAEPANARCGSPAQVCALDNLLDEPSCGPFAFAVYNGSACRCTCRAGRSGPDCSTCTVAHAAPSCAACAPDAVGVFPFCSPCGEAQCSFHGTALVLHAADLAASNPGICACLCRGGWAGASCSHCPTKFDQATCSSCARGFFGYPGCAVCSVDAQCSDRASSAVVSSDASRCECSCRGSWTGAACEVCPAGFDASLDCSSCADGFRRYPTCEKCRLQANQECRAVASPVRDTCRCSACSGMWTGPTCSVCPATFDASQGCAACANSSARFPVCNGCSVSVHCNAKGSSAVSEASGQCLCACAGNWEGPRCDVCPFPFDGGDCDRCAAGCAGKPPLCRLCSVEAHCSGHAHSSHPNAAGTACVCTCSQQWSGDNCSVCAAPYSGSRSLSGGSGLAASCNACAAGRVDYPFCTRCEDVCVQENTAGFDVDAMTDTCVCRCRDGWEGPTCAVCGEGFDASDGTCVRCREGRVGETCQACDVATQCHNHAAKSEPVNSTHCACTCAFGWTGARCEVCMFPFLAPFACDPCAGLVSYASSSPSPFAAFQAAGMTPQYLRRRCAAAACTSDVLACSGNGNATGVARAGTTACRCSCFNGWSGEDCSVCDAEGFAGKSCNKCGEGRFGFPVCAQCVVERCSVGGTQAVAVEEDRCVCKCKTGFAGRKCERCLEEVVGSECGLCGGHGPCDEIMLSSNRNETDAAVEGLPAPHPFTTTTAAFVLYLSSVSSPGTAWAASRLLSASHSCSAEHLPAYPLPAVFEVGPEASLYGAWIASACVMGAHGLVLVAARFAVERRKNARPSFPVFRRPSLVPRGEEVEHSRTRLVLESMGRQLRQLRSASRRERKHRSKAFWLEAAALTGFPNLSISLFTALTHVSTTSSLRLIFHTIAASPVSTIHRYGLPSLSILFTALVYPCTYLACARLAATHARYRTFAPAASKWAGFAFGPGEWLADGRSAPIVEMLGAPFESSREGHLSHVVAVEFVPSLLLCVVQALSTTGVLTCFSGFSVTAMVLVLHCGYIAVRSPWAAPLDNVFLVLISFVNAVGVTSLVLGLALKSNAAGDAADDASNGHELAVGAGKGVLAATAALLAAKACLDTALMAVVAMRRRSALQGEIDRRWTSGRNDQLEPSKEQLIACDEEQDESSEERGSSASGGFASDCGMQAVSLGGRVGVHGESDTSESMRGKEILIELEPQSKRKDGAADEHSDVELAVQASNLKQAADLVQPESRTQSRNTAVLRPLIPTPSASTNLTCSFRGGSFPTNPLYHTTAPSRASRSCSRLLSASLPLTIATTASTPCNEIDLVASPHSPHSIPWIRSPSDDPTSPSYSAHGLPSRFLLNSKGKDRSMEATTPLL
ncbi:Laminin-like protein epi-1 [Diplonema papillatum]|nr:Laminin-like protein epi-1 [Diplonema papillatum]